MAKDLIMLGQTPSVRPSSAPSRRFRRARMARQPHQSPAAPISYKIDVEEFIAFAGLRGIAELRSITRAHVIAWRKDLEQRGLAPSSIRRKLSALFDYLCEHNAVAGNPVDGVKRPTANNNEGSTPALGDAQVRRLLEAPPADTLKGVSDRAILATLLYHGIRNELANFFKAQPRSSRAGSRNVEKSTDTVTRKNTPTRGR